ncbi:MAG: PRC-barrel domain containing protein [Bradyrhizobium sp.]|nr:MAG: PRC-barrel domain containing protein [Bradyrhizobium sp.]
MRGSLMAALSVAFLGGAALAATAPQFVSLQASDMLSSNLVGLDIRDDAGHDIGKIQDIAFDGSKAVKGYVVAVGGFLGVGARFVVVDTASVSFDYDAAAKTWRASMDTSVDQLKSAPTFRYQGRWNGPRS